MIACRAVRFWPDGREEISPWRLPPGMTPLAALHRGCWRASPSAVLVRKTAIEAAGGFDPRQRYCENTDLWRRILWRHAVVQIDEPLVRQRKHDGCRSQHWWQVTACDLRHQIKARFDTPADLRHTLPPLAASMRRWAERALGVQKTRPTFQTLPIE